MKRDKRLLFILRRALWYGVAAARDLQEAFGVCRRIAVADLNQAVDYWGVHEHGRRVPVLLRDRGGVMPVYPKRYPSAASPQVMLDLLAREAGFWECGLRETEIDVVVRRRLDTVSADVVGAVMDALVIRAQNRFTRAALRIRYVGMKLGDTYRMREVLPLYLEFEGMRSRLYAVDLQDENLPVKAFVLQRIASAQIMERDIPIQALRTRIGGGYVRVKPTWDPRLTPDQREALLRELGAVPDGTLRMPSSLMHSFRSFYTTGLPARADQHIVWPPIIFYKEEEE